MKPESARALWIFAMLLAVAGSAIPSASGSFFLSVIATLVALPPAIFGTGGARLGGAIACTLSLALAVTGFPAMQKDQTAYAERMKKADRATSAPAPGRPGEIPPSGSQTK